MNTSSRVFFGVNNTSIVPGLAEVEIIENILKDDPQKDIVEEIKEAVEDFLQGEEIQEELPEEETPEEKTEETPKEHVVKLSFLSKLKKIFNI